MTVSVWFALWVAFAAGHSPSYHEAVKRSDASEGLQETCSAWSTSGGVGNCAAWLRQSGDGPAEISEERQLIFMRYLDTCRLYGIKPLADVLNHLHLRTGSLKITGDRCSDLDLRALTLMLSDANGTLMKDVRILDLSGCSLGVSSIMLIANLLKHKSSCIQTLDLSFQFVGFDGACAIASAMRMNPSGGPRTLRLKQAFLGDVGGRVMVELLKNASAIRLEKLDLQNNFISYDTCCDLTDVARAKGVELVLTGNRVYDAIICAATHGIGVVLSIIGCFVLQHACRDKPRRVGVASAVYGCSLLVLYMSSTLFHSFFALGRTVFYLFETLDYSGVFILIAGSWTPFLSLLFHGETWASVLLVFMWASAVLGICTSAFYRGPFAMVLRLTFFLALGWTALFCIRSIAKKLGKNGTIFFVLGGVLYSLGIPFLIKGFALHEGEELFLNFPDHAIWHLFVLAASTSHFLCILWYVVDPGPQAITEDDSQAGVSQKTRLFANVLWQRL